MTKSITAKRNSFLNSIKKFTGNVDELHEYLCKNVKVIETFGVNLYITPSNAWQFIQDTRSLMTFKVIAKPSKRDRRDRRFKLYTYRNILEILVAYKYRTVLSKPELKEYIIKLSNRDLRERLDTCIADLPDVNRLKTDNMKRQDKKDIAAREQVFKVNNVTHAIDTTQPLELQLKSLIAKLKVNGTVSAITDLEYILESRKNFLSSL